MADPMGMALAAEARAKARGCTCVARYDHVIGDGVVVIYVSHKPGCVLA